MADYKGIYYNNDSSEKYFEGGAHFRYKQLYKILEKLSSAQKMRLKREKLIKSRETKAKDKIKRRKSYLIKMVKMQKIIFIILILMQM